MTVADLSEVVSQNLVRTYFALGLASPGASIQTNQGFEACFGNFDHPICSFASKLCLDPWTANRLAEIAFERKYFNVYSMPGDSPRSRDIRDETLTRAGFVKSYCLEQLFWEPKRGPAAPDVLQIAQTASQKRAIAVFMANLFFSRHTASFRRRVADATSEAGLDLYSIQSRLEVLGSLMVVEDQTVLGLYNLCVKASSQNRGIGTKLVAEIQRMAYARGKFVGLQCDPTLTSWYERQGFESCGFIDVYALPGNRRVAIMK